MSLCSLVTLPGCATGQRRGFGPGVDADAVVQHEKAFRAILDSLIPGMGAEAIMDREQPQQELERICTHAGRPGAEEERIGLCLAIADRLGPETPLPARLWMIRQLERIGGDESVDALAALLAEDPEPRVRENARRALQRNPSTLAGDALRSALQETSDDPLRVALCNALGDRAEAESVSAVAALTDDRSPEVVAAAIAVLADIGGDAAIDRLDQIAHDQRREREDVRNMACAGLIRCADRLLVSGDVDRAEEICLSIYLSSTKHPIRLAALRGYAAAAGERALPRLLDVATGKLDAPIQPMAISLIADIPGEAATQALVSALNGAPAQAQTLVIDALAARGDRDAAAALLPRLESDNESVRAAAARALQTLGNAACIVPLAKAAARESGDAREAARRSLARLPGEDIDTAMISHARGGPPSIRAELIRAMGERGTSETNDLFLDAATANDEEVRIAAFEVLARRGGPEELAILVRLLTHQRGVEDTQAAEDAIVAVARRVQEPEQRATPLIELLDFTHARVKASLIRTLGRIGGGAALEAVRDALADAEPEVYDAAVRALAAWPEPVVLDDLVSLAGGAPERTHRVLALRGYIRLVRAEAADDPLGTLERLRYAVEQAEDPAEKKAALAAAGDVPHVAAIDFAQPYLNQPELREEAAAAMLSAAQRVGPLHPERALAAVDDVLGMELRESLWTRADEVRKHVERYAGYITQWKISGPYGEGSKAEELLAMPFAPEAGEPARPGASEAAGQASDAGKMGGAAPAGDATTATGVDPAAQRSDGSRLAAVEWRDIAISNPEAPWMFDLAQAIGGSQRCAYARTYIWSSSVQPALLEIGSDDGVKVWLNGEVVHENNTVRGMAPAQDKVAVTLQPGVNVLMLKIAQAAGGWGFVAGVRSEEGEPLPGLRFAAEAAELAGTTADTASAP